MLGTYEVYPLTPDRWDDLLALFGEHGAYSGCWCMWWRRTGKEFSEGNDSNRAAFQNLVMEGAMPGLLAYAHGKPAGWTSLGPRQDFGRIQRSPILKPIDDQPAWALVCFFIQRAYRGQGVASRLLQAAIAYAREHGAPALEAYPIDTGENRAKQSEIFTGTAEMFRRAGFEEIARRSPTRPIMRLNL